MILQQNKVYIVPHGQQKSLVEGYSYIYPKWIKILVCSDYLQWPQCCSAGLCRTLWKSRHVTQKAELSHNFSNSSTDTEEDVTSATENCNHNLVGSWVRGNFKIAMETGRLFSFWILLITIWHVHILFHQTTVGVVFGQNGTFTAIITQQNSAKLRVLPLLPLKYAAVCSKQVISTAFHLKRCPLWKHLKQWTQTCFSCQGKLGVTIIWPEWVRVEGGRGQNTNKEI